MNIQDNDIFLQAMAEEASSNDKSFNEILTGKVISENESEYFLHVGGKSEIILPKSEVVGSIAINDEIQVVPTKAINGIPQASQKKAHSIQMMKDLQEAFATHKPIKGKLIKIITNKEGKNAGFEVSIEGIHAFLPLSHIHTSKNIEELIGQTYMMAIIKCEGNQIIVSERIMREEIQKEFIDKFIKSHTEGDQLSVIVDQVEDSFAIVEAENVKMFMHITEFDWKFINNLKDVLKKGDQLNVQIKQINLEKNSIKVSRKSILENPFDIFLRNYNMGDNIKANVVRFVRGAAIIEAEDCGVNIFLPVGEMSWTTKVVDPKRLLNLGDRLEVKIINIDPDKKQITASLRDLLENPWHNADTKYALHTKHEGHITSITEFGLFVVFDDGIQGLIRTEDIDWNDSQINLSTKFKKRDPITAIVLNIDPSKERLRLGIKQLSKNPYQNFADNHSVGSTVSAKVVNITKDGVEVEVEGGLLAFIHISQLSTEHIDNIDTICKIGDEIKAVLRRINVNQKRIELSIRDLTLVEEKNEISNLMQSHKMDIPTLGSVFKDILK